MQAFACVVPRYRLPTDIRAAVFTCTEPFFPPRIGEPEVRLLFISTYICVTVCVIRIFQFEIAFKKIVHQMFLFF